MENNIQLIHGDALIKLDKLIEQGVKVDAIITDPPYGVNFKAHYDDSKNMFLAIYQNDILSFIDY